MRPDAEWLETDGLGGFATGPVIGPRTRRYHALLVAARRPPTDRVVLVNGCEPWIETPYGRWALQSQRYVPDVVSPAVGADVAAFTHQPWPTWTYRLPDGTEIVHELLATHASPTVVLSWRLTGPRRGVTLAVRPFLTGRDLHALHVENPALRFDAETAGARVRWQPYAALPAVVALSNGEYTHDPLWYRRVQYDADRARGYEFVEDVASPGVFRWNLSVSEAVWLLGAEMPESRVRLADDASAVGTASRLRLAERRRRGRVVRPTQRAGDAYLVKRGDGESVIAGYPWFGDWGRDTCIAVRGLCLASGQFDRAATILGEWAAHIDQGMLPNRFPEQGEVPEYNAVDASLWYVVAVHELLRAAADHRWRPRADRKRSLIAGMRAIVAAYLAGTRYRIRVDDDDGLLAAGVPGVQLTWMDARIGDRVITPRVGKPVEVQALWINALRAAAEHDAAPVELGERAARSFVERFWRADVGYCYDVVDADHQRGHVDASFRPNQLFAVGGLPWPALNLVDGRRLVDAVEARLWTPIGPRTLAPDDPSYVPRYAGDQAHRDAAYHQGTAWPWLTGAFVEAWVRVRGNTPEARRDARSRFVTPLLARLDEGPGVGHLPEVADGDPPHHPGGSPFQAWSIAELQRLDLTVL